MTAVSYHRLADVPASLLSFTIAWIISRIFSFSGDALPSFTLFGLLCAKDPDSPGRWVVSSYTYNIQFTAIFLLPVSTFSCA